MTLCKGSASFQSIGGRTVPVSVRSSYPLKLLCRQVEVSRSATSDAVPSCSVHILSHGGGLVSDDHISMEFTVGRSCSVNLITPSSTKVYRMRNDQDESMQRTSAVIEDGGLLLVIPHPVVCFSGARYRQVQEFALHGRASLVVVDWLTAGRVASGERWRDIRYRSDTQIKMDDRDVLNDSIELDDRPPRLSVSRRMMHFNVIANVILVGPRLSTTIQRLLAEAEVRQFPSPDGKVKELLFSVSKVVGVEQGVAFRAAASSTLHVQNLLREKLADIEAVVGRFPW